MLTAAVRNVREYDTSFSLLTLGSNNGLQVSSVVTRQTFVIIITNSGEQ